MTKLTEIVAGQTVYFVLRRPAFVTSERVYRPSRRPQQSHGYSQVIRALGRVMSNDLDEFVLTVQPAFEMDTGPNRPCYPVIIPWWALRQLKLWTGEWTSPTHRRGKEMGSTVLNRLRMAYHREPTTEPLEQPSAVNPAMIFEEVRIQ